MGRGWTGVDYKNTMTVAETLPQLKPKLSGRTQLPVETPAPPGESPRPGPALPAHPSLA